MNLGRLSNLYPQFPIVKYDAKPGGIYLGIILGIAIIFIHFFPYRIIVQFIYFVPQLRSYTSLLFLTFDLTFGINI